MAAVCLHPTKLIFSDWLMPVVVAGVSLMKRKKVASGRVILTSLQEKPVFCGGQVRGTQTCTPARKRQTYFTLSQL